VHFTLYDWLGSLGALLIVGSYLLLQLERVDPKQLSYSLANAIGAALIIVSLVFDFNLSALIVESFWLAVSVFGIARSLLRPGRSGPSAPAPDELPSAEDE
jgi:hypothetical protein